MYYTWFMSALNAVITYFCFRNSPFNLTEGEQLILGGIAFTNTMMVIIYSDYKREQKEKKKD